MARGSADLHGNAPDKSPAALLIIDMINDMEFEGAAEMLEHALPAARAVARLRERVRAAGIPTVFVNDNFGRWRSNFEHLVEHCLNDQVRGGALARLLQPAHDDYFVLKPKHSGFFHTPLELLLDHLGARRLLLTGITADICVLFTAYDAYMRDYALYVPADCVASRHAEETEKALGLIQRVLKADTRAAETLDLSALAEPLA